MAATRDRQWYLHDQSWQVLTAVDNWQRCLHPEDLRPGRRSETPEQNRRDQLWQNVSRDDVALNKHTVCDADGNPISFRRVVFIGDAGTGKSKALGWLNYRLSCPWPNHPQVAAQLVLFMDIRRFAAKWNELKTERIPLQRLTSLALEELQHLLELAPDQQTPECRGRQLLWIREVILRVQLCLILDGLDQVGESEVDAVAEVLESPECSSGRFILAGRPSILNSARGRRLQLHLGGWTWIHVAELNKAQQIRYLGWLPDGSLRYQHICPEARSLLTVPRVLYYLRKRAAADLKQLKTAAAVYAGALDFMLHEALQRTAASAGNAPPDSAVSNEQVAGLLALLALAAWESVATFQGHSGGSLKHIPEHCYTSPHSHELPSSPSDSPPDYEYNVTPELGFPSLITRLRKRYDSAGLYGRFDDQWLLLERLNVQCLDAGLFDDDRIGLNQLVWANRSIHEFCLARYFALFAEPAQQLRLWDWIHIRTQTETDQYYQFWQFLCEMPASSKDPEIWLKSIELLFCPGIPDHSPQTPALAFAKRSNEMICRSWTELQRLCSSPQKNVKILANSIRLRWQSEFEQVILAGHRGATARQTATQLTADFLTIEQTPFRMGTSDERVIPPDVAKWLQERWDRYRANPDLLAEDYYNNWTTRGGQREREREEPLVRKALRENDFDAFAIEFGRWGNSFQAPCEQQGPFQTTRRSVTNAWFRLYDPTWGDPHRQPEYASWSKTPEHPAVDLNFFDSWVFSQWLTWQSESCRLLWEDEWEFCARLGLTDSNWWWDFWFAKEFDASQHAELLNCRESGLNETRIASPGSASPASKQLDPQHIGLLDFQGNHWVWCQDQYRHRGDSEVARQSEQRPGWRGRHEQDAVPDVHVGRVLRGGSFRNVAIHARCSYRSDSAPSASNHYYGCRLARAAIRKP